ncbi:small ribosomal subunit Rsm22 family protein [Streptomyces sp. NPDC050560]|uniref:small ribosomal subunit Rsm22 family protein n=1 Tax=Streptomyces sp. NPDC050560 TaxID=3365630 RepID=UPI0037A96052
MPSDPDTGARLRSALDALAEGLAPRRAADAVARLMAAYRGGPTPTAAPVLRERADVVAYAAYRMPATFEAARAALTAAAGHGPAPDSQLDIGGGTGAAVWAAQAVHGGSRRVTVLDWAAPALDLGRELAAAHPALAGADFRAARIGPGLTPGPAGLVTVSYVLGELTEADRAAVVDTAAAAATGAVVVVEPGSREGHARVLAARDRLMAAGLRIAAPCPHTAPCPLAGGADWCHLSARVARSSLHRRVKAGSLPYEDEKFSYVAAVRGEPGPAPARVIRRPRQRKGQVLLDVCKADGTVAAETVTKRQGERYRRARDTAWGDPW